ncbi:MAG: hypothetical protein IJ679_07625 [Lachnospiraceae bacterium]|nr:hypothetical protein [Lachnospiraceae bacterium]
MRRWTRQNTITSVFVMIGIVLVMWGVMMLRDYRIEIEGGVPILVARIFIPRANAPQVSNGEPGKLIVTTSSKGSQVNGYEFRISRFRNMAFAHAFRSVDPKKEIAKLKPGKRYFVQVRCYKANNMGRTVTGRWSGTTSSVVRDK